MVVCNLNPIRPAATSTRRRSRKWWIRSTRMIESTCRRYPRLRLLQSGAAHHGSYYLNADTMAVMQRILSDVSGFPKLS